MTTAVDLADLLSARRFRFADEAQLQQGIAQVLAAAGVAFERERSAA